MVNCETIWVDGYIRLALNLCRDARGNRIFVCGHEGEVECHHLWYAVAYMLKDCDVAGVCKGMYL